MPEPNHSAKRPAYELFSELYYTKLSGPGQIRCLVCIVSPAGIAWCSKRALSFAEGLVSGKAKAAAGPSLLSAARPLSLVVVSPLPSVNLKHVCGLSKGSSKEQLRRPHEEHRNSSGQSVRDRVSKESGSAEVGDANLALVWQTATRGGNEGRNTHSTILRRRADLILLLDRWNAFEKHSLRAGGTLRRT